MNVCPFCQEKINDDGYTNYEGVFYHIKCFYYKMMELEDGHEFYLKLGVEIKCQ